MLPSDDDEVIPQLPVPASPPPPPAPPASIEFPIGWLLDNASNPLRFRALNEVLVSEAVGSASLALVYTHKTALRLMLGQEVDGTWAQHMLTPASPTTRNTFAGIGTVPALQRLLEWGWDRESPPLNSARRILFRLLAEDRDPAFLFELRALGVDEEAVAINRRELRDHAAATLARAGFEADPRLRGAVTRACERVKEFLVSSLADDPFIKVGATTVLHPDAAPPSVPLLQMLAFMPKYRDEHQELVDLVLAYLSKPAPKHAPIRGLRSGPVAQPDLLLGDPLGARGAVDSDIPFATMWLELVARLGVLRRHAVWSNAFDRLLDARDRDSVWRPSRNQITTSSRAIVWARAPLSESGDQSASVDVTFRLALVGRFAGHPIDPV